MKETGYILLSIGVAVTAFIFAGWLFYWVRKQPAVNEKNLSIGKLIVQGANAFLKKEYFVLFRFAGAAALLILIFLPSPIWLGNMMKNMTMAMAYIAGTIFSAAAGKIGLKVATMANVRTAEAARRGIKPSFLTGFRGGAVMGMAVVGSSLLGVALVFLLTNNTTALLGFSFGASTLALFAKAGGGIFTKTADISADLVGKVELGIPEDDPRNPAVIADNVGDNVGDVAGMGADLFDSHVASMSAALVMAASLDRAASDTVNTGIVFIYAALGLLSSIIGIATARMGKRGNPTKALNNSTYITTGIFTVLTAFATLFFQFSWRIWGACVAGLLVGVIIGISTDYFTNDLKKPVRSVAKSSRHGPAFTILSGFSYGLLSVLPAMLGIGFAALFAYKLCEPMGSDFALFGISMSAVGMLSIVGMIISNDAYGPIVDNARGLAEMTHMGEQVLEITDELDSAGNTVKAITKGFAIAAAGLTVIALLGAFMSEVNLAAQALGLPGLKGFDIVNPLVFFGLMAGSAIPLVFSALLILGVNKNAQRMVTEIRRQFDDIEGLKEGRPGVVPQYDRCIEIAAAGAIKELIPAGLTAILFTLAVGFIGGVQAMGGFLIGNIISGLLFALLMSNSGGLWDNSKKYIEAGNEGGKGSVSHKSAVVGDTVGDPFKDTAGPSINTQITVVTLTASLLSTLFLTLSVF